MLLFDNGLYCLRHEYGQVVTWDRVTMNVHDQRVHPFIEGLSLSSIVLGDWSFRSVEGIPDNCKLCQKGTWNGCARKPFCQRSWSSASSSTFVTVWPAHPPSLGLDGDHVQRAAFAFSSS